VEHSGRGRNAHSLHKGRKNLGALSRTELFHVYYCTDQFRTVKKILLDLYDFYPYTI
jgi:hypothetical protein